jgi:hypothetical protein
MAFAQPRQSVKGVGIGSRIFTAMKAVMSVGQADHGDEAEDSGVSQTPNIAEDADKDRETHERSPAAHSQREETPNTGPLSKQAALSRELTTTLRFSAVVRGNALSVRTGIPPAHCPIGYSANPI